MYFLPQETNDLWSRPKIRQMAAARSDLGNTEKMSSGFDRSRRDRTITRTRPHWTDQNVSKKKNTNYLWESRDPVPCDTFVNFGSSYPPGSRRIKIAWPRGSCVWCRRRPPSHSARRWRISDFPGTPLGNPRDDFSFFFCVVTPSKNDDQTDSRSPIAGVVRRTPPCVLSCVAGLVRPLGTDNFKVDCVDTSVFVKNYRSMGTLNFWK